MIRLQQTPRRILRMLSRKLKAAQSHGTGLRHIKYPLRTPPHPNPQPQTLSSNSSNVPLNKTVSLDC